MIAMSSCAESRQRSRGRPRKRPASSTTSLSKSKDLSAERGKSKSSDKSKDRASTSGTGSANPNASKDCGDTASEVKKTKTAEQCFLATYTEEFPCIVRSDLSQYYAHCNVCGCDFKVTHGGINDVERHCEGKTHKEKAAATNKTGKVTDYFQSNRSAEQ